MLKVFTRYPRRMTKTLHVLTQVPNWGSSTEADITWKSSFILGLWNHTRINKCFHFWRELRHFSQKKWRPTIVQKEWETLVFWQGNRSNNECPKIRKQVLQGDSHLTPPPQLPSRHSQQSGTAGSAPPPSEGPDSPSLAVLDGWLVGAGRFLSCVTDDPSWCGLQLWTRGCWRLVDHTAAASRSTGRSSHPQ